MASSLKGMAKTQHTGVFRLKDGRLFARVTVHYADRTSRQAKQVLPLGATMDDARRLVLELKASLQQPIATPTPHPQDTFQTVQQYCVRWLKVKGPRLSPTTAEGYAEAINERILPRLGWMECKDVTRQAIEAWVVWVEKSVQPATRTMRKGEKVISYANPKAGQPYHEATMRKWWRCLKTILGDMAADLKEPTSAAQRVRQPQRPELPGVREQRTLDADGMGTLLVVAGKHFPQHYASIAVMAMTGMRAGEVFGLQWDAVDFTAGTITVRRAISKGQLRQRTKTGAWRTIPMHAALAAVLEAHKKRQIDAKHVGLRTGLLFPSDKGTARTPSGIRKIWTELKELAGTDIRVGNQVLRRSVNTQLVLAGVDRITTRAILGHTSEAMTQRYAGIGMDAKKDAVSRITPTAPTVAAEPSPTIH